MKYELKTTLAIVLFAISVSLVSQAAVAEEKLSVTQQVLRDVKQGKLKIEGDHSAVEALVLQRDIPITYDYINRLVSTPNAFGDGPACIVCHSSSDPAKSYRGLDLSTCDGIHQGATESPVRVVVVAGKPLESQLVTRLRNNRMPLGISFLHPTDTDSINKIKGWIDSGAKNDDHFNKDILPMFRDEKAFGSDVACINCHESHRDPPSFHEVNLASYESIMKGAFSRTNARAGKPGIPIVIPGDAVNSPLFRRLTENRMPPGIDPNLESDHANVRLLMRWIEQGAKCK